MYDMFIPWSRYIAESEHLGTRVDPRITTPLEEASLRTFERFLRNVTRWAAVASAAHPGRHNITVGAIGFDQEQLCGAGNAFCLSHCYTKRSIYQDRLKTDIGKVQKQLAFSAGFCWSHGPNGTCNASTFDAITAKNNAYLLRGMYHIILETAETSAIRVS